MRTCEVIEFFRTQVATAQALGIKQSSVADWGEFPPPLRQLQIQRKTRGRLRAEPFSDLIARPKKSDGCETDKARTEGE